VRRWRTKRNIQRAALAATVGIHVSYLTRIEGGRCGLSFYVAVRLARALGVRVSALVKMCESG
jgi:transcriptional regulator with XRE-family HTH domain